MSHFFISRAGEDRDLAIWIARVLRESGHTTTLQDDDFKPGNSFVHEMASALDRATHIIGLLSPDYMAKEFTRKELYAAIADDAVGTKRLFIPVLVTDCERPRIIKDLIYIDFVKHPDETTRRQKLLDAIAPNVRPPTNHISIQHLPIVDRTLIGRERELGLLEAAWTNPRTHFLQIVAPAGTGKTALVDKWFRRHINEATIFGWSFYSQGTRERSETPSEPFVNELLRWLDISVPPTDSLFRKVGLLVDHLRRERVLLILDGVEPLQHPTGDVRDPALCALLQELATLNRGLVLVTTRIRLSGIPDDKPIDLENLTPGIGARYLKHLGIQGTDDELRQASKGYGNHALALTLLGTYLKTFCQSDIRRRADIKELYTELTKPGRHARKVMASYTQMYKGLPELDILGALGYFDRPAEPEALRLVLTEMEPRKYEAALSTLHDARLILSCDAKTPIDCHPLIREYFATRATQDGHSRLYEYYKTQAPHRPDTLQAMMPLFHAVYHGCQAGRHSQCLREVYRGRILRGDDFYLNLKLGANATDLSLLANFFDIPWNWPASTLAAGDHGWLINRVGCNLRAVGRLNDALEPLRVSAETAVKSASWADASIAWSTLSELLLTLDNVQEAIAAAFQSITCADRNADAFWKMAARAALADALHCSGDLADALRLFQEAERLAPGDQTEYPILSSVWGFRYCDLLLAQGKTSEVLRRATQTLSWAEHKGSLLDIGLDHLSLGRAHPAGSHESVDHLDQAIDLIRRSGRVDHFPRALLARARRTDLAEAWRIAARCGMRRYLKDPRLSAARKELARA